MIGLGLLFWEGVFWDDLLLYGGKVFFVCDCLVLVFGIFVVLAMLGISILLLKLLFIKLVLFDGLFFFWSL